MLFFFAQIASSEIYTLSLHDALPILVSGDAAELRNVLSTIAVNSLDAMPDGGQLTFRTDTDGQRVRCHVTDTGVGMPEDRKSTRLNSSHLGISYAVFCLKKKINIFTS